MAPESGVLVVTETVNGQLTPLSLELLGAARGIAAGSKETVTALSLGPDSSEAARIAIAHGADGAAIGESEVFQPYNGETWLSALGQACQILKPSVILLGQTAAGRELAPRLAVRLGSAPAMDCVRFSVHDGRLIMTRPCFGGRAYGDFSSRSLPQVATVRSRSHEALDPDPARTGGIQRLEFELAVPRTTAVARTEDVVQAARLEDARVVVAGGRGVGGPDGFQILTQLADVLEAAVGASRAAVDLGWVDLSHQIGLTAKVISPDLYFAVGISGASQHLAGLSGVRNIVAINRDPNAEIFKVARFGVVADWQPVVEALTQELGRSNSG